MTFEAITVMVVLSIFAVFFIYAQKAEKYVAAQAKAKLEMQGNKKTEATSPNKAIEKSKDKKAKKVIV